MIDTGADAPPIVRTDVCVVGSGPAGITVALELQRHGISCVLLESGVRSANVDYAALNETPQIGITTDQTSANRVRALGGTSALWGGMCRPLDESDFEQRPWVPDSGWPINRQDMLPHYERAHEILGLPPMDYDLERVDPARGSSVPLQDTDFQNVAFFFDGSPMRFGSHYEAQLAASTRIQVFLDSTVVDIVTQENGRAAIAAHVVTLDGKEYRVEAQRFVLATGAIQTARLLLNSDSVHATGLGNQNDLVGRYFLQHPVWNAPYILAFNEQMFQRVRRSNVKGNTIVTAIRESSARRHSLLNFHFLAIRPKPSPETSEGRRLLRNWRKRAAEIWRRSRDDRAVEEYLTQLNSAVSPEIDRSPLRFNCQIRPEQAPNHNSRITLNAVRDAVGMRQAVMDWQLTSFDRESMWTGMRVLAGSMARQNIGRVNIGPTRLKVPAPGGEWLHGGHHQYGTTRMSDSPKRGVVDRNCRVHGVDNLYVASSAVFPTTGYVNPTLSIVAMAARVAQHLSQRQP